MPTNSIINVMGVCYDVKNINEFVSKTSGVVMKKRDILLIDKNRDVVTVSFWNDDAEQYDESLLRTVLTLIDGRVNDYMGKISISINRDTTVDLEQCSTEAQALKQWFESQNNILVKDEKAVFKYTPIADIYDMAEEMDVNILGVCFEVGDLKSFFNKNEKELKKRNITISDQSMKPVIFSTWNYEAENFKSNFADSIISIQKGQIKDNNGTKILTHTTETIIKHEPNDEKSDDLKNWYNSIGKKLIQNLITNMAFDKIVKNSIF